MAEHRGIDVSHVPLKKRASMAARAALAAATAPIPPPAPAGPLPVFEFTGHRNSHANSSHYPTDVHNNHNRNSTNGARNANGNVNIGANGRQRHQAPQRRQSAHGRSGAPSARSKGSHCFHCGTTTTPLWRKGPSGPNTLCNACGTRWKRHGSVALRRPISTSTPAAVAATRAPTTDIKRKKKPTNTGTDRARDEDFDYVGATTANNNDGPAATVRSRVRERRPRCSECGTTSIPKSNNNNSDYPRNANGEILCAGCEEDFRPAPHMHHNVPVNMSLNSSIPISNPSTTPISTSIHIAQPNRYNHNQLQLHRQKQHLRHTQQRPRHPQQQTPQKAPKIEPRPQEIVIPTTPPLKTYPEPPPLPIRRRMVMLPKPPASSPTPKAVSVPKPISLSTSPSTPMEIEAPSKSVNMNMEIVTETVPLKPTEVKVEISPATPAPEPRHLEKKSPPPAPVPAPAASAERVSTHTDNAADAALPAPQPNRPQAQTTEKNGDDEYEEGEWIHARDADAATRAVFKSPPQPGPWIVRDPHLQPVPPTETIQQPLPLTPELSDPDKETISIPIPMRIPISIPIAAESKSIAKCTTNQRIGNSNIPGKNIGVPVTPCVSCGVTDTPLWRKGPAGRNTLCNACGTRWKRHGSTDLRPPQTPTSTATTPIRAPMMIAAPPTKLHLPIARKRKLPMKSIIKNDPQNAHLAVVQFVRKDTNANGNGNTHIANDAVAIGTTTGNGNTESGRDVPYLPSLLEAVTTEEKDEDKDVNGNTDVKITENKKAMEIEGNCNIDNNVDNKNLVEKDPKDQKDKKEMSVEIVKEATPMAKTEVQIKAVVQVQQDSKEAIPSKAGEDQRRNLPKTV